MASTSQVHVAASLERRREWEHGGIWTGTHIRMTAITTAVKGPKMSSMTMMMNSSGTQEKIITRKFIIDFSSFFTVGCV